MLMWFGREENPKIPGKKGSGVGVREVKAVPSWGGHLRWPSKLTGSVARCRWELGEISSWTRRLDICA